MPHFDWKAPDYDAVFRERAERLQRIRQPGFDLDALKAYYKTHHVEFITEWGMTFDPRNVEVGISATVPFLLFQKQADFIMWLLDRWKGREDGLAEKSRDMGASWLCCAISVWLWLFHPGSTVGWGSLLAHNINDRGNPKAIFLKIDAR